MSNSPGYTDPRASVSPAELAAVENREWIESLEYVLEEGGPERVRELLTYLRQFAQKAGVKFDPVRTTPYINTIPADEQPHFPGNRDLERRIKNHIRWNAMAMVVRGNRREEGIGGHIATYQSAATLYEIGFNHFFRAPNGDHPGDLIYYQGHASPGMYARAFLEGRLTEMQLHNFRRELAEGGGLSSYPHPWLMPNFWQMPTVSMGLGPIQAIYQARFIHYMTDRGLIPKTDQKVWAFLGDGETDEPESLGALTLASREKLNNLIFVVNCNLQRLDGPVRGNGKIIQELEAAFTGAGWNVIKVVWGTDWDRLLERDEQGRLIQRLGELVDGWFQKYVVSDGAYIRDHFTNGDPELERIFADVSDDDLRKLRRGGHDPAKVYAAFKKAYDNGSERPTVILAHTIKGYGLGEAGEAQNVTHQQKKLDHDALVHFRNRFDLPIPDDKINELAFYKPPEDSEEMKYLRDRRKALGGSLPARTTKAEPIKEMGEEVITEFYEGTGGRPASTTMVFVRILSKLLKDESFGKLIVPIIPDEARTFGMESLFRAVGIYSHGGQLYEPVDRKALLYYKEATDGQILEEGITEAGSISSFIAAGTAYSTHGVNTIPFYTFYSMFGMQRVGDLVWAAGDIRAKGFLMGATSGRTTLNGEGLQHQDGNSHQIALTVPNLQAYDPAYAYELAMIIRDGINRMYAKQENIFYYLTIANNNYDQIQLPGDADEIARGVTRGLYKVADAPDLGKKAPTVNLLAAGPIMPEAVTAQHMLAEKFGVAATIYSLTSFKALYDDARRADRWNMLNSDQKPRTPYVTQTLNGAKGPVVIASDYIKATSLAVTPWIPNTTVVLGTDGYGRSESRPALRDFFEVDSRFIALGALAGLCRDKTMNCADVMSAMKELEIDPDKVDPTSV
jgi:pyruvate dehydrogenase E1 component